MKIDAERGSPLSAAHLEPSDAAVDAALARAALEILDEVESAELADAGSDAVAAGAARDRGTYAARSLLRAFAESHDEIPPFTGSTAELAAALAFASTACAGELRAVLEQYLGMRREVTAGAGSISSG